MAESEADKKAREAKEEADKKAREAKEEADKAAEDAKNTQGTTPVDPPRGASTPATPADKVQGMSEREKAAAGTGSAQSDILLQVLNNNKAPEPEVRTFNDNRWKVGEGHSMLDQYVQGEEVDIEGFILSLGKTDAEKAYSLQRLLRLGALVRMADQEPRGGVATGPLAPLMSQSDRRGEDRETVRMLMGPDIRERLAGQPSDEEAQARFRLAQQDRQR